MVTKSHTSSDHFSPLSYASPSSSSPSPSSIPSSSSSFSSPSSLPSPSSPPSPSPSPSQSEPDSRSSYDQKTRPFKKPVPFPFFKNPFQFQLNGSQKNGIAGVVAGCMTAVALHPLDIVKTRFQVSDGLDKSFPVYRNTWNALQTISRKEGIKGFYAGITPALVAGGISWGLYFFFYSHAKEFYGRIYRKELTLSLQLASATQAGVITSLITHPLWLVKTRLQLQVPLAPGVLSPLPPYRHVFHAVQSIWREEGPKGFTRGLGPSLLLVSHGVIQMIAYEALRKNAIQWRSAKQNNNNSKESQDGQILKGTDFAILGGASKTLAVLSTYPFQVVRSRLQIRPDIGGRLRYTSTWKAVRAVYKHEGWRGFYKGFVPHIVRVAPSASITFFVFEAVLKLLK